MSEFFRTNMGHKFYGSDVPKIARNLGRIADALEKANELEEKAQAAKEHAKHMAEHEVPSIWNVKVTQKVDTDVLHRDDIETFGFGTEMDEMVGIYPYEVKTAEQALEKFHNEIPVKNLDHYEIEAVPVGVK